MKQLSLGKIIFYHLYPGILITLGYILITPFLSQHGYPPQLSFLLCFLIVGVPVFLLHLVRVKRDEKATSIWAVNDENRKLATKKLVLYAIGLVVFSCLTWGLTQPINKIIVDRYLSFLPAWYTLQDFQGYSKEAIQLTLLCNLLLNGVLAPVVEEFYFRGYLLPRMQRWGIYAFLGNTFLFSLYHFWQPYVFVTIFIALLPMNYLVWRTKDLRLAILTHFLLNIVGALLSFGLLFGN